MEDFDDKVKKLFKELDKTKLKQESNDTNILIQCLLQKLMLSYVVDIQDQLDLKQKDLAITYPTELISSLKNISELYLKMKHENNGLQIKGDNHRDKYVF